MLSLSLRLPAEGAVGGGEFCELTGLEVEVRPAGWPACLPPLQGFQTPTEESQGKVPCWLDAESREADVEGKRGGGVGNQLEIMGS